MPDLTTMHLKCLLAQATPGPWESRYGVAGVPEGWDEYWVILQMGRHRLPLRSPHYPLEDEEYANFDLAAAAPELAQEVINLRDALGYLVEETLLAAENSDDAVVQKRVADAIKTTIAKVQGEPNE